jgi:hypothetical protein
MTKEKLKIAKNGQWSLEKATNYHKFKKLMDMTPDSNVAKLKEEAAKPYDHKPSDYGKVTNIDPKDIAHHSQWPEDSGKATYQGDFDYDYVRGKDGRVYQKVQGEGPDFSHLDGKYFATNLHENDHPQTAGLGTLTGAEKMGNIFKPNRVLN